MQLNQHTSSLSSPDSGYISVRDLSFAASN
nr:MAG TPA: hypothetical protein [Caudoviricetes sp.]